MIRVLPRPCWLDQMSLNTRKDSSHPSPPPGSWLQPSLDDARRPWLPHQMLPSSLATWTGKRTTGVAATGSHRELNLRAPSRDGSMVVCSHAHRWATCWRCRPTPCVVGSLPLCLPTALFLSARSAEWGTSGTYDLEGTTMAVLYIWAMCMTVRLRSMTHDVLG
jgi:hypothetical protein